MIIDIMVLPPAGVEVWFGQAAKARAVNLWSVRAVYSKVSKYDLTTSLSKSDGIGQNSMRKNPRRQCESKLSLPTTV